MEQAKSLYTCILTHKTTSNTCTFIFPLHISHTTQYNTPIQRLSVLPATAQRIHLTPASTRGRGQTGSGTGQRSTCWGSHSNTHSNLYRQHAHQTTLTWRLPFTVWWHSLWSYSQMHGRYIEIHIDHVTDLFTTVHSRIRKRVLS